LADFFCEAQHLWLVIATLFIALVAMAGGKTLSGLVTPVLKRVLNKGPEVNVNFGGNSAMPEKKMCDPEDCPAHQAENQRSLQNQKEIRDFKGEFEIFKEIFFKQLAFIKTQNNVMLRAMVKNNQLEERDIPKEPL
jgi:hypothetical protein